MLAISEQKLIAGLCTAKWNPANAPQAQEEHRNADYVCYVRVKFLHLRLNKLIAPGTL